MSISVKDAFRVFSSVLFSSGENDEDFHSVRQKVVIGLLVRVWGDVDTNGETLVSYVFQGQEVVRKYAHQSLCFPLDEKLVKK